VLLGSATPSLETWHNATPAAQGGAGRFQLHTLPDRVAGGRMPTVEIVDLVEEGKKRDSADRRLRSIGPTLEHAIRRVLDRDEALTPAARGGGRVMLLLNRRGYASYICCPDQRCGWFMTCNHCDVTVVYHKRTLAQGGGGGGKSGVVRCHHCLAEQRLPAQCPVCEKNVNTFGFGTQRLEDEIADLFPSLVSGETMLRLDSDTMRRASDYFSALDRFRRGEVRLLLGTQMIAKGLDFPDVELIGVINADTAINMPDFRAAERTFALVSQVAGRAGRSDASAKRARVIVQTFTPQEPAIQYAAAHDFEGFAAREIGFRRESALPPVGRMARIVCRDEDAAKAERHAREVHDALAAVGEKRLRLRAPAPCPISRVAGHYRWAVELMAPTPGPIQNALAAIRASAAVRSDAHTAVDVDPVALL
jgi:primosomal protein N' (replication factor Y)